ncbi:MAG: MFS transporter [Clostridia bacterium]|nr:MFS transporter [Clostridia bacterium]
MVKSLDKKWKVLLYSFAGFGPNFLMVLMGAFFTDAINPAALGENVLHLQSISGACLILPAVFPILWMIAKAFDGIIDIPFAQLADRLNTKHGRYRPLIAVGFIPMVVSYILCWIPFGNKTFNTIWIVFWALVFFSTYTLNLISYYGSLSVVCADDKQRGQVSSFKAFFDTISYCLVYALVPLLLQVFNTSIDKFALISCVLMLTMLIPLFIVKEGEKYGYPENEGIKKEKVNIIQSLKLTFGNKIFLRWIIVNCCSFFGLQMFLVSMNALITGGMGFSSGEMALINTFAFAPVPIMLFLFNKLKKKKGIRFTYQTCLLSFALAILSFLFANRVVVGDNKTLQMIIAIVGAICGSWSIGSFFMMPYLVPTQVASVEQKLTGKNHSAMYFAAQAVTTSVIGAIASSLVYENIKMLFVVKGEGIVWGESISSIANSMGVLESQVFNLGNLIVPIIVSLMCVLGFILAFKMPKDYDSNTIAKEIKKLNPESNITDEQTIIEKSNDNDDKDSVFINISLSILSGFIFGFIWQAFAMRNLKKITEEKHTIIHYLLCCFVPFYSAYYLYKTNKVLMNKAKEQNIEIKNKLAVYFITSLMFPILPINIISLAILQHDMNKF